MNFPTDSQWEQYSALCLRLQPFSEAGRAAKLQALRATGAEDSQVLSLVAVHFASPPDPDRDRTGQRLGQFTLKGLLGSGGMGVVYRAEQQIGPARREVAVKLLHPSLLLSARDDAMERFVAEIKILVALHHEGIARIYDGGIREDPHVREQLPYLAMELVPGGQPLTVYAKEYDLSLEERLALLVRVCQAVRYAHEHLIVHRDLKPANILVDSEGRPVVIDFGLAHVWDRALLPGAWLVASGTPAYMSPEQVSGTFGAVSDKTDVYALGVLLYELLTGQRPYTLPPGGSFEHVREVIVRAVPRPLRSYGEAYRGELDAMVMAALAKQPADRPRVAVLQSRIERYLQRVPARPPQPSPPPGPDEVMRQHLLNRLKGEVVDPLEPVQLPTGGGTVMHLAYPNVQWGQFQACVRYRGLLPDQSPDPPYRRADPKAPNLTAVHMAVEVLVPERAGQAVQGSTAQVYECPDAPGVWQDAFLEFAYLLALIRCSRTLALEAVADVGDVWCTGAVEIHEGQPVLGGVDQRGFDATLTGFLAQPRDRLFLVPAAICFRPNGTSVVYTRCRCARSQPSVRPCRISWRPASGLGPR